MEEYASHLDERIKSFPESRALYESLWKMDEKTFLEVIQPRFWYIGQDGLWIWKCNALRAMANSGDKGYYKYIKEAAKNPGHKIRDMALWACQKLGIQYEM